MGENGINYEKMWIDEFPELGTGPISTKPFFCPEHYRLEQEKVFSKVWLEVGRVEEIPEPGDYFVREIEIARASIIIIRGRADGEIRAFHNVCPHRGNKLLWETQERGNARGIKCRFHAWTFSSDGRLVGVPGEDKFYNLDRAECGLIPVAVDVFEGFIFINLDPSPEQTLVEFLGPMADHLRGFPYHEFTTEYFYRAELNANWKVCLDAFSEAYHVLFVHAETVGKANVSADNPLSLPLGVELHGRHRSAQIYGNPNHTHSPTSKIAADYGITSLTRGQGLDTMPDHINPHRSPDFNFDLSAVFPSFMVHLRPGEYFTHNFWPLGPDRTLWEGRNYYRPAKDAGQRFSQEYSHLMRRNAWLEDTSTMEATHAGLASGALKNFVVSDPEILIRHGHKVLDEYIRA